MEKNINKKRGIVCIIIAAFCFALMMLFVRLSGDLPVMQKCLFRNLPAVLIAFITLKKKNIDFKIKKDCRLSMLFRCLFGASGMIANFYALDHIVLADASMLNKMSPFFAMLLSIPILKERPSKREWIVLLVAMAGVFFVVKPTTGIASIPAFFGLYGGFAAGTAYTFIRKMGSKGENSAVIVLTFSLFTCLITLPFAIFEFKDMSLLQSVYLLLAGIAGAGGQFGITMAYEAAPAKTISIFDYTQVVFAALLGLFAFGELPDFYSLIGYTIIIAMAILKWKFASRK